MTPVFNILAAKFQAFDALIPDRFPLMSLHSESHNNPFRHTGPNRPLELMRFGNFLGLCLTTSLSGEQASSLLTDGSRAVMRKLIRRVIVLNCRAVEGCRASRCFCLMNLAAGTSQNANDGPAQEKTQHPGSRGRQILSVYELTDFALYSVANAHMQYKHKLSACLFL